MQNPEPGDRLSWGDSVFLHLEREDMPFNVACVCVFEGEIAFKDCVQFVASKLPLIPRYLKRVVPAPLNLGLPSWEYDPTFDIGRHLSEVTLKHGSDAELKTLAGKILSTVMNRQHPLWDMTLVHGLKGNRSGLVFRLHHCLADGIAGVGIMNVLMDASPVAPRLPRRKLRLRVPPARDVLTSITNGCVDSYSDFAKRILAALADVSSMAERLAANGGNLATDEFARLLPELSASTERLRFNIFCRGPQKFTWAEIPLAEIKAIKSTCGTSVNDVILALVTATIRRYIELHGDPVKGRMFRMMVPVNLRGSESPCELGNRISLVPVTIPLDIRNPRKLLAAVHRRNGVSQTRACRRIGEFDRRLAGHVPDFSAGVSRSRHKPVALHAFQPGVHECAGTAISALLARPRDAALLSLCPGRRRDGAQLRHPDLQRHGIFRVQRRCARGTGSAATGDASAVEFRGPAGSRGGHIPAKERRKEAREEGARKGKVEDCIDTGTRAGVSSCIHSSFASRFGRTNNSAGVPRHGGKSLNAIERLTGCGGTSS